MQALPEDFRFEAGGNIFSTRRLHSLEFLNKLASAAMSPAIARDDTKPDPFLYSSDRIALLLGQGVLALCPSSARQEALYEDGIVSFDSRLDCVDKMIELRNDDQRRQSIAERGWRIAHDRTNSTRVAKFLLESNFGLRHSEPYEWPSSPIC